MGLSERVLMPSFAGATGWLNAEPLGLADLRGRVVLVNFWTWTCINWLRQEPYVRAWSGAYRDDGLVVVGVHTPEFSFEHDRDGVRRAVVERAIDYPVAIDNDYAVWGAFANLAWPALYFVDRDGAIRDRHYGEGRYAGSERVLQELLGVERDLTRVDGVGVEAAADWEHLGTPETYLGYDRGLGPSGAPLARLGLNQWALDGAWAIEAERVVLTQAAGTIAFRFRARDVHLVLDRAASAPIPWRVRLDGEAPGASAGVDADAGGHGVLDAGRMYQLVRLRDGVEDEHTIEITFLAAGAQAYSFTFG